MTIDNTERRSIKGLIFHEVKGRTMPRFVCQICDDFISDARAAVLLWDQADDEADGACQPADRRRPAARCASHGCLTKVNSSMTTPSTPIAWRRSASRVASASMNWSWFSATAVKSLVPLPRSLAPAPLIT